MGTGLPDYFKSGILFIIGYQFSKCVHSIIAYALKELCSDGRMEDVTREKYM